VIQGDVSKIVQGMSRAFSDRSYFALIDSQDMLDPYPWLPFYLDAGRPRPQKFIPKRTNFLGNDPINALIKAELGM
jgi:hypothetical protein